MKDVNTRPRGPIGRTAKCSRWTVELARPLGSLGTVYACRQVLLGGAALAVQELIAPSDYIATAIWPLIQAGEWVVRGGVAQPGKCAAPEKGITWKLYLVDISLELPLRNDKRLVPAPYFPERNKFRSSDPPFRPLLLAVARSQACARRRGRSCWWRQAAAHREKDGAPGADRRAHWRVRSA